LFFDDLIDVGERRDGPGARFVPLTPKQRRADCLMAKVTDAALSGGDRWI
jgi:hypothetical protein